MMGERIYIGCSIGPVYQTIRRARCSREIWMASYMFSFVAQRMCEYLNGHGAALYSPWFTEETGEKLSETNQAGLFSDRLYFSVGGVDEDAALQLADDAFSQAVRALAEHIAQTCGRDDQVDSCAAFLMRYLYICVAAETACELPLASLNKALDLRETWTPFVDCEDDGHDSAWLFRFLNHKTLGNSTWLREQAITATTFGELAGYEEQREEEEAPNAPEETDGEASEELQHKRYLAMVRADGDFMGTLLGRLKQDGVRKVSDFLFRQGMDNLRAVLEYGGMPLFFGGDDMFFLAPIYGKGAESILYPKFILPQHIDNYKRPKFIHSPKNVSIMNIPLSHMSKSAATTMNGNASAWPNNSCWPPYTIQA